MYIDAKIIVMFLRSKKWMLFSIWIFSFFSALAINSLQTTQYRVVVPLYMLSEANNAKFAELNNLFSEEVISVDGIYSLYMDVLRDREIFFDIVAEWPLLKSEKFGSERDYLIAISKLADEFNIKEKLNDGNIPYHVVEFYTDNTTKGYQISDQIIDKANEEVRSRLRLLISSYVNKILQEYNSQLASLTKKQKFIEERVVSKIAAEIEFLEKQIDIADALGIASNGEAEFQMSPIGEKDLEQPIGGPMYLYGTGYIDVLLTQLRLEQELVSKKEMAETQEEIRLLSGDIEDFSNRVATDLFNLSLQDDSFIPIRTKIHSVRAYDTKPNKFLFSLVISIFVLGIAVLTSIFRFSAVSPTDIGR